MGSEYVKRENVNTNEGGRKIIGYREVVNNSFRMGVEGEKCRWGAEKEIRDYLIKIKGRNV